METQLGDLEDLGSEWRDWIGGARKIMKNLRG